MGYTTKLNKNISRAKAKGIRRISFARVEKEVNLVLEDIRNCFEFAESWNDLTPSQRISLEEYYTHKVLHLLELGSKYVSRSLPYRLREATPEEEENMEGQ